MPRQISSSCRVASLALVLVCAGNSGAEAEEERGLAGRFGFVTAARSNQGILGQQYSTGVLFGVHAGLELSLDDSPWSLGVGLTTLVRGYYFSSAPSAVDSTVDITEASLGLRLRRLLPGASHHLIGTAGGAFSASNLPLPPADERRYLGGYGGLGYDRRLWGEWNGVVEARYARYLDGPQNLTVILMLMAGFGGS